MSVERAPEEISGSANHQNWTSPPDILPEANGTVIIRALNSIGPSPHAMTSFISSRIICNPGYYVVPNGLSCLPCQEGRYQPDHVHSKECLQCPDSTFSLGLASTECINCPNEGVTCSRGRMILKNHYWRVDPHEQVSNNTKFYRCFNEKACLVNQTTFGVTCNEDEGYTGMFCANCLEHLGFVSKGGVHRECAKCFSNTTNWTILIVTGVFLVLCVLLLLKVSTGKQSFSTIVLRIFLNYCMVMISPFISSHVVFELNLASLDFILFFFVCAQR